MKKVIDSTVSLKIAITIFVALTVIVSIFGMIIDRRIETAQEQIDAGTNVTQYAQIMSDNVNRIKRIQAGEDDSSGERIISSSMGLISVIAKEAESAALDIDSNQIATLKHHERNLLFKNTQALDRNNMLSDYSYDTNIVVVALGEIFAGAQRSVASAKAEKQSLQTITHYTTLCRSTSGSIAVVLIVVILAANIPVMPISLRKLTSLVRRPEPIQ